MSRKRRASVIDEPNNNDGETEMDKKRCTMKQRLISQLKSDFTAKVLTPIKSPDGQPTSRFGRKITKIDWQQVPRQRKSGGLQVDQHSRQKTSLSKRKVRKTFSIHNTHVNAVLRLVSNRQPSVLTKSPIQKLISVTKIGLNTNQFQTIPTDNRSNSEPIIIDLCKDVSVSEATLVTLTTDYKSDSKNDSSTTSGTVDYEDNLKQYVLDKKGEVIDEIDLTSSPDGSECGDDNQTVSINDDTQPNAFPANEADSIADRSSGSPDKTDSQKNLTISDNTFSASLDSDANLFDGDKAFSDGKSDDCIITDNGFIHNCSTSNRYVGQIVWAALCSYPFWPAIVFNDEESKTFRKGELFSVSCKIKPDVEQLIV